MRYITIPNPSSVMITNYKGDVVPNPKATEKNPIDPEPLTFETFLLERLCDPEFSKDAKGNAKDGGDAAFTSVEARTAIKHPTPDGLIKLEDAVYECLLRSVNKPTGGYNMALVHNFVGFIEAVRTAKSEPPAQA